MSQLTDFSDRLSPMLVKELRQGLRTKSFIAIFLTLQITLMVVLLSAGLASSFDDVGDVISSMIFTFFAIAVLIFQPLRGINSISGEIKDKTIQTIVLTELSSWRIIFGKWNSIISQSALLLVTIVPFLILRYFFGGMNLLGELMLLFLIFITSAGLTATTIALSATKSLILRVGLPMIGLPFFGLFSLIAMASNGGVKELSEICALTDSESRWGIFCYIAAVVYYLYFALSIGASLIASYAENNESIRRIVGLIVTVATVVISLSFLSTIDEYPIVVLLAIAPPIALALCEPSHTIMPIWERLGKRPFGAITRLFLYPGWASGVLYTALLVTIIWGGYFFTLFDSFDPTSYHDVDEEAAFAVGIIASFLLPAIVINFLKKQQISTRVSVYFIIFATCCLFSFILMGLNEVLDSEGLLLAFCFIPQIAIALMESHDAEFSINVSLFLCALYGGALFIMSIKSLKATWLEIRKNHQDSAD